MSLWPLNPTSPQPWSSLMSMMTFGVLVSAFNMLANKRLRSARIFNLIEDFIDRG